MQRGQYSTANNRDRGSMLSPQRGQMRKPTGRLVMVCPTSEQPRQAPSDRPGRNVPTHELRPPDVGSRLGRRSHSRVRLRRLVRARSRGGRRRARRARRGVVPAAPVRSRVESRSQRRSMRDLRAGPESSASCTLYVDWVRRQPRAVRVMCRTSGGDHGPAADALGVKRRAVGVRDQIIGAHPRVPLRYAERRVEVNPTVAELGRRDHRPQPLGEHDRSGQVGIGQNRNEFIAAIAPDGVADPRARHAGCPRPRQAPGSRTDGRGGR